MYKERRVLYDDDAYDGASLPRPFRIFDLHQIHIRLMRAIRRQTGEFFTGSQTANRSLSGVYETRDQNTTKQNVRDLQPDPAASEDAYLFDRPYVIMFVNFAL